MTATAEPPARPVEGAPLNQAEGVELLGSVHGCGYRDGAALVRRADGQMVQLGQLMYGLLECVDGQRDAPALAEALSERLGRRVQPEHVVRLAQKLAAQGLLAGTEGQAPPRSNPLLALRWKVLVTDPKWTKRLTTPFGPLFRPWVMWPVIAGFGGVFWFVLIHKGVASATSQAFKHPGCSCSCSRSRSSRPGSTSSDMPPRRATAARRRGAWEWVCTWCGRRSTPTSPTPTGYRAGTASGRTWRGCTSTRSSPWSRWGCGWWCEPTRCSCSSRSRCSRWSSSSRR